MRETIERRLAPLSDRAARIQDEILPGYVASVFDDVFGAYRRNGNVSMFQTEFTSYYDRDFAASYPDIHARLNEPVHATLERLALINGVKRVFGEAACGLICGGSMSYGRFLTIHRGDPTSDIDLLIVYKLCDLQQLATATSQLTRIGLSKDECRTIADRLAKFRELYGEEKAQMMSHKAYVDGVELSLKFTPLPTFTWELAGVFNDAATKRGNAVFEVLDYKQGSYSKHSFYNYSAAGENEVYTIREEAIDDGEFITAIPACIFKGGALHSGDHQNHVLPMFELWHDVHGLTGQPVQQFKEFLVWEVVKAQLRNGGRQVDILNFHPDAAEVLRKKYAYAPRHSFGSGSY